MRFGTSPNCYHMLYIVSVRWVNIVRLSDVQKSAPTCFLTCYGTVVTSKYRQKGPLKNPQMLTSRRKGIVLVHFDRISVLKCVAIHININTKMLQPSSAPKPKDTFDSKFDLTIKQVKVQTKYAKENTLYR